MISSLSRKKISFACKFVTKLQKLPTNGFVLTLNYFRRFVILSEINTHAGNVAHNIIIVLFGNVRPPKDMVSVQVVQYDLDPKNVIFGFDFSSKRFIQLNSMAIMMNSKRIYKRENDANCKNNLHWWRDIQPSTDRTPNFIQRTKRGSLGDLVECI